MTQFHESTTVMYVTASGHTKDKQDLTYRSPCLQVWRSNKTAGRLNY